MTGRRSTWTWRYRRDRDRVLGRRMSLSVDPELAADQLAERLGGVGRAEQWAGQVLAALARRRTA